MEALIFVLRFIWELPQNLLGLLVFAWVKLFTPLSKTSWYKGTWATKTTNEFGVSLGLFIFYIDEDSYSRHGYKYATFEESQCKWHEMGHSIQSLYLGPLYLLVIGLPSITMNILTRFKILKQENYYHRWPENWADSLANIFRD